MTRGNATGSVGPEAQEAAAAGVEGPGAGLFRPWAEVVRRGGEAGLDACAQAEAAGIAALESACQAGREHGAAVKQAALDTLDRVPGGKVARPAVEAGLGLRQGLVDAGAESLVAGVRATAAAVTQPARQCLRDGLRRVTGHGNE